MEWKKFEGANVEINEEQKRYIFISCDKTYEIKNENVMSLKIMSQDKREAYIGKMIL